MTTRMDDPHRPSRSPEESEAAGSAREADGGAPPASTTPPPDDAAQPGRLRFWDLYL